MRKRRRGRRPASRSPPCRFSFRGPAPGIRCAAPGSAAVRPAWQEVMVSSPWVRMPRLSMHMWRHLTTTPTAFGSSTSISALAICIVMRSCTCRRLEKHVDQAGQLGQADDLAVRADSRWWPCRRTAPGGARSGCRPGCRAPRSVRCTARRRLRRPSAPGPGPGRSRRSSASRPWPRAPAFRAGRDGSDLHRGWPAGGASRFR
jgi:hypothetical protein